MSRTPPDNTKAEMPRLIWAFEKQQGTIGATFYGRLISRARIYTVTRDSGTVLTARYNGRIYRIYPPEDFTRMRDTWASPDNTFYLDGAPLRLPLEHHFLFDCDKALGFYA